jgi:hypothetical protein
LYAACPGDAINFILGISTLYRSKIYRHPDIEKWPQTVYDRPMQAPFSSIPWNTPALWCEANASLAAAVGRNRPVLAEPQRQAGRIQRLYQLTFPLMDRLCSETCPDCTDICCRRAWVWADFKDLLFFHLADISPARPATAVPEERPLPLWEPGRLPVGTNPAAFCLHLVPVPGADPAASK